MQVLLVNSYVLYKTAHIYVWKMDSKSVMMQYDFRYRICDGLGWYAGEKY